MKNVALACVGFAFLLFNTTAPAIDPPATGASCPTAVATPALEITRIWAGEAAQPEFTRMSDVNGVVVQVLAEFFASKKRLPVASEMQNRLQRHLVGRRQEQDDSNQLAQCVRDFNTYFTLPGAAATMDELLGVAVRELPDTFAKIRGDVQKKLLAFFKKHLRMPSTATLASELTMREADLRTVLGDPATFWAATLREREVEYRAIRRKLVQAFLRAVRQTDRTQEMRIRNTTPRLEDLLIALTHATTNADIAADHAQGRFTLDDLRALLGMPRETPVPSDFPAPAIFEGLAGLEAMARLESPGAFATFVSQTTFSPARRDRTMNALETKRGFLATAVVAGVPLDEGQYAAMLRMAEEMDYDILVYPVNQILEGLDRRLLDHPRIHIVTNTIENYAVRFWQIPIMARNSNPFASLDQRGQFQPGQVIIVGHPQQAHRVVPTGVNHIRPTELWSTGCLSQGLYPFRLPVSGRMSAIAGNYHRNGFLVLQKADAHAGARGLGLQNHWHVRPVEYVDDRYLPSGQPNLGGTAGFTDMGRRYQVRFDGEQVGGVAISDAPPRVLVPGDIHDLVADQRLMAAFAAIVRRYPNIGVLFHDGMNGNSFNPHEAQNLGVLIRAFTSGDLDLHREVMGQVQLSNAFQALGDRVRTIFVNSNHPRWLTTLVMQETMPSSQMVMNGQFLTELRNARVNLGYREPLDYVFHGRERYIAGLPPDQRRAMEERAIPVHDTERVFVIPYGENYTLGPEHRTLHLNFHGDQGANGARGSVRAHAMGSRRAIVGDSHQPNMWGGLTQVGVSIPARHPGGYQNSGYSSWSNAFALGYADGTSQLVTYHQISGTFEQRPEHGVLSPARFFGDHRLQWRETDNERLPNVAVMDQHTWWVDMLRGQLPESQMRERGEE